MEVKNRRKAKKGIPSGREIWKDKREKVYRKKGDREGGRETKREI